MVRGATFALCSAVIGRSSWAFMAVNKLDSNNTSLNDGKRMTCEGYDCPRGFFLKPHFHELNCEESGACTHADVTICCQVKEQCKRKRTLIFQDGHIKHSNLGSKGPDQGDEVMVYTNVFPFSFPCADGEKTCPDRQTVNLDLNVKDGSTYTPHDIAENIINTNSNTARINLEVGTSVDLSFHFVDARTGDPATYLEPFWFSFIDIDQQHDGKGTEKITLQKAPWKWNWKVDDETDIVVEEDGDLVSFHSAAYGSGSNSVGSPRSMMQEAKSRALSIYVNNTLGQVQDFDVTFSIADGYPSGRNFEFGGSTNIVCPDHDPWPLADDPEVDMTTPGPLSEQ